MEYTTGLFEWATKKGLTLERLHELTGYSTRHLRRLRDGEYPLTETAVALLTFRLGELLGNDLPGMFVPSASQNTDIIAQAQDDSLPHKATDSQPDASDPGHESSSTTEPPNG